MKDWIPTSVLEFYNWQKNLIAKVVLNAVAWGIPAGTVTIMSGKSTAYDPLYQAITNKQNRTQGQVDAHDVFRKQYIKDLRTFGKQYLLYNVAITAEQRDQAGLPVYEPRGARPAIEDIPFWEMVSKPGSIIQLVARTAEDSSRASMQEDADEVEIAYAIGTTAPANRKACPNKESSTKAKFKLTLEPEDAGKKIYGFMRWVNATDDAKSGPWSTMKTVTIYE